MFLQIRWLSLVRYAWRTGTAMGDPIEMEALGDPIEMEALAGVFANSMA